LGATPGSGSVRRAVTKLVIYAAAFIVTDAVVVYLVDETLPGVGVNLVGDTIYIQIALSVGFGFLIVSGIANVAYWSLRKKHTHSTAVAVKNMLMIVGAGGLAAAIAGGVAGGASGVAFGGFLGVVVGFASQQVLGQALAGIFLLTTRPFKVDDRVTISGEDGVVDDMSTMFTTVRKDDGTRVLIPNGSILGNKVYLRHGQEQAAKPQ
jgi:small conductance mechanosensitive channel